jgi:hypothetical protein
MILHNIPDDSNFIEIPSASLCAKGFLEGDLDIGNVFPFPSCAQKGVCKAEDQEVFHHFFAEIVVDAEGLQKKAESKQLELKERGGSVEGEGGCWVLHLLSRLGQGLFGGPGKIEDPVQTAFRPTHISTLNTDGQYRVRSIELCRFRGKRVASNAVRRG